MKSSTRLDSAVFQLTPTRTRYDLFVYANGKMEKIASGLLTPFLAHLKTAQEQTTKGGYSIILEPQPGSDSSWFTKLTVERFVRFVSSPEVLERVYTLESEILQIVEAIAIQGNNDLGPSVVEDYQAKPVESIEGSRHVLDPNEEKAIVLYKPGTNPSEANRPTVQEENSKVQLQKVLETRKKVLQKEQGMAFARAVAAGFDVDNIAPLISFAESFGASRLLDACVRFIELWKKKHETGQWLEIEASETLSCQPDLSVLNASSIMHPNEASPGEKSPINNQHPGQQEYFQGQFPQPMFPSWPMHSSPGGVPVFQGYPMQGMPYYQNFPGNGPYFQPPYPQMDDLRHGNGKKHRRRRHSMDSRDGKSESETSDTDALKARSKDDIDLEKDTSQSQELRKKSSRSGRKKSGMVVIRNINYITSKRQNSADNDSQSASQSETDEEDGDIQTNAPKFRQKNSERGNLSDKNERGVGKEADSGNWQAFQTFLLRDDVEEEHVIDKNMLGMEKEVRAKRKQNMVGDDALVFSNHGTDQYQGGNGRDMLKISGNGRDMLKISGNGTRLSKASTDESLISAKHGQQGDRNHIDLQSTEVDGRRVGYRRTSNDDLMLHRRENQSDLSDPLAVNGFERANNLDTRRSYGANDDSCIVPFRSFSVHEGGTDERNAISMDSELPSLIQKAADRAGEQFRYNADDLSLMPDRGLERGSISYDPALDYEMHANANNGGLVGKKNKEAANDIKKGLKKSDTLNKKTVGPIRKGKPSKMSPLDEARARAEKLRSYKVDLQKVKKDKEDEAMKRLEALKAERQKRIAARGGSIPTQKPASSLQTRKLPTKISPSSNKASKFTDSELGPVSPLQRFPRRTASTESNESYKASKSGKLNSGGLSAGSRLSRSVASLPIPKKVENGVAPDTKASVARIRRLSEPTKMNGSQQNSSLKSRTARPLSKPKNDGSDKKNLSAIVNYDRSKTATLPELKIKLSKRSDVARSKTATTEMTEKVGGVKPSESKRNKDNISHHNDGDDNPVIEKTVVMLQCQKPSVPYAETSNLSVEATKRHHRVRSMGDKTDVPNYAATHALDSLPKGTAGIVSNSEKESQKPANIGIAEKPYCAPVARVSALEDQCNTNGSLECRRTLPTRMPIATVTETESVKVQVSDSTNMKLERIAEASDNKPHHKESKGFIRLLKFGKKNHSSATGECESDHVSVSGSEADESIRNNGSSTQVHTLKNLIFQDKSPSSSSNRTNPQKSSRSFSLLSPFRSKTSEKKLATA